MTINQDNLIFSKNIIEFVTVAREYCAFVESASKISKKDFLDQSQKILALLYLKASLLPNIESVLDYNNEKSVTEEDWIFIKNIVNIQLGAEDIFIYVNEPIAQVESDEINVGLSEIYADIYQDTRDLLALYNTGDHGIMNDAIWECKINFEQYWGPRLIAALSSIHNIIYGKEITENEEL